MKTKYLINSLLIPMLAVPALAGTNVTKGNGQYTVQSCEGYRDKTLVGFKVGENGIEQFETAENGCATKTYTEGIVQAGQKIIISGGDKITSATLGNQTASTGNQTTATLKFDISARLVDDDTVELTGCNSSLRPSNPVIVTNRDSKGRSVSKSADVRNVNGRMCFVVQFNKGEINNGDEIGVGIYGVDKPIAVAITNLPWKTKITQPTPDTNNSGSTTGNGAGNSSSQTQITADPSDSRKFEKAADIRAKARAAANRFANLMVNNMGEIENIRYNLYLGFRSAEALYMGNRRGEKLRDILGQHIANYREYNDGANAGSAEGAKQGLVDGQQSGRYQGSELAKNEVADIFDKAMATGQKPAPAMKAQLNIGFNGLNANISEPADIEARFKAKEKEIQKKLREITVFEDGIILGDDIIYSYYKVNELYSLDNYKFDYLLGFYRAERAFEAWKQNIFQDKTAQIDYYTRIGNTSEYQHAEANRQTFYNEFIDQYDSIINAKWNAFVTKPNVTAETLGNQIYRTTLTEYIYDLGKVDGYKTSYKTQSITGFYQTLQPAYTSTYNSVYNSYATSAVVTDVNVEVVPTNRGSQFVTLGDVISVVIKGATNKGMADGQIDVSVNPNAEVGTVLARSAVGIKALSRLTTSKEIPMAYVRTLGQPDGTVSVDMVVNGRAMSLSVRTNLETLVTRLAQTQDAGIKNSLLSHLVGFLKKEWNDKSSFLGNGFDDNTGTLMVERLARTAMALSASEKAQLASMKTQIRQAYGERPGFFSGNRDDYDSAMKILASAGL